VPFHGLGAQEELRADLGFVFPSATTSAIWSFTDVTVPLLEGTALVPSVQPGDVLFFNGSLVH
jgi:hypothetical protein